MKLPRFSLRTLFILIAIVSVPLAWVAYQLNWIRQRHEFLRSRVLMQWSYGFQEELRPAPWPLGLFGENSQGSTAIMVRKSDLVSAYSLFPEATFYPQLVNDPPQ